MTEDQVSSGEFADLRPNPKVYVDSNIVRWQSGASAESVSASTPQYTQTRVRVGAAASKTNACVVVESGERRRRG